MHKTCEECNGPHPPTTGAPINPQLQPKEKICSFVCTTSVPVPSLVRQVGVSWVQATKFYHKKAAPLPRQDPHNGSFVLPSSTPPPLHTCIPSHCGCTPQHVRPPFSLSYKSPPPRLPHRSLCPLLFPM
eukprot:TRINITY_DN358_c0_g2_i2.p2 TRINITY_DN358_c0_g2~~TRINITY_DN358_c0_g2_i2.p2  ORF type:complete len:129 (+),score=3.97 TRINITY_DN358_c0_g2_i2:267-653(+)